MRSRRSVIASLALTVGLTATGCGFSPMYGNGGIAAGLSDIRVETGEERVDFLLQEALLDRMGARHADGPYTLRTRTDLDSIGLGVGADAVVRRYAINLDVQYELFRDGDSSPVLQGSISALASYDVADSVYASVTAEQDAQARAADQAAERLTAELARAMQDADTW